MRRLPLAGLAIALALAPLAAWAAPSHIHLSWQGPTDTTMTVTWRSAERTGAVEYGAGLDYGQSVAAVSTAYQGSYLHIAKITGLTPGTTYHYRCGATGAWSSDSTFATAPPAGTPFRFAAYGDSRTDDAARARVRSAVQASNPAFSINTGDLVDNGGTQSLWDQWFTTMEPLLKMSPMLVAVGNHEADASNYWTQFALPTHAPVSGYKDESFYSFDYGNTHFVSLTTQSTVGGAQLSWLEKDLAAANADPKIKWIVAFAHQPPYSSGSHGSNLTVRETWTPVFEKYGVDVTFWGHDHHYERSHQLVGGKIVPGGVTYIVTGGAGAPLYSVRTPNWWTAASKSVHHFIEVDVTDREMTLETKDATGAVFDSLTLSRNVEPPPPPVDGGTDPGSVDSGNPDPTDSGTPGEPPVGSVDGGVVPDNPGEFDDDDSTEAPGEVGLPGGNGGNTGCSTAGGLVGLPGLVILGAALARLARRRER